MKDSEFEWDEDKAALNLTRHGVSFDAARFAFADAFGVEREDRREDYAENRYTLIAMVEGRFLFVAYTMREDLIRIIMARYAEPFEKRLYHDHNTQN